MAQAQPPRKAEPPKPATKRTSRALAAEMLSPPKSQDEFRTTSHEMAARLGWSLSGDAKPDWQINGFAIADAQAYLTSVAHSVHVATVAPSRCKMPEASGVAAHLGVSEADDIAALTAWLDGLKAAEAA